MNYKGLVVGTKIMVATLDSYDAEISRFEVTVLGKLELLRVGHTRSPRPSVVHVPPISDLRAALSTVDRYL